MAPSKKRPRNRNAPPPSPRKTRKKLATMAAPETDSVDFSEDYNIRSLQRTQLLTEIKRVIGDADVSPTFWACCQLADIERLRAIVTVDRRWILGYDKLVSQLPLHWSQRFPYSRSEASSQEGGRRKRRLNSDGQSWVNRSEQQVDKCKERDGYTCVLTKKKSPQAAHIFPYTMLNSLPSSEQSQVSKTHPKFSDFLYLFWDEDRVDKWKETIFPDSLNPNTGVDRCFNLISLNSDAHTNWTKGFFALKPLELSSDRKQLTVQFFWQVPSNYNIDSRADLLTEPTSSKGLDEIDGYYMNSRQDDGSTPKIKSGDVFTLTTKDPRDLPLPSVDLLDMQWVLQRVVGMSGAAGWPKLEWDDNGSSDDDCWLVQDHASDKDAVLKRVSDWVDTGTPTRTSPEFSGGTSCASMVSCH